jgi:hypothetical protein
MRHFIIANVLLQFAGKKVGQLSCAESGVYDFIKGFLKRAARGELVQCQTADNNRTAPIDIADAAASVGLGVHKFANGWFIGKDYETLIGQMAKTVKNFSFIAKDSEQLEIFQELFANLGLSFYTDGLRVSRFAVVGRRLAKVA